MSGRVEGVRQVVAWLPAVRWITCVALWMALAAVVLLPHLDLSLRAVAPIGLASAIMHTLLLGFERGGGSASRAILGLTLCADAGLLTGLLDITGGPFNPFIVMFGTYIWLAAVTAGPWAIPVTLVSAAGFGWLVLDHVQAELAAHHRLNDFPTHLFAMWFSGSAIAELVAHYVARARSVLAQRQLLLDEARARAARSEHLAALTTLAAGAAHELSTPLATIAIASRELELNADRLVNASPPALAVREDARLIRQEVDRCQLILDSMSGRAAGGADSDDPLTPEAITSLVRARLLPDHASRLQVEMAPGVPAPAAPGAAVVQAVASLLKNAFDASGPGANVTLRFSEDDQMVRIEVRDEGRGMSAEILRRAGEPFFTTKETGQGLGLGLFLTRAFAERAGGALRFESGDGTTAVLEIPHGKAAAVA